MEGLKYFHVFFFFGVGGGLRHGDWVQFNVAVDRRDKLERATNIELLDESFVVSGEKRETGVVAAVKVFYLKKRTRARFLATKTSKNQSIL